MNQLNHVTIKSRCIIIIVSMNFKSYRRQKSHLFVPSERESRQRRSMDTLFNSPGYSSLFRRAKQIYYAQSDIGEAVKLFEQYLEHHPNHNEALYLCGVACLHINRIEEAIQRLTRISEEFQNHANALLLAAMAYNKLGSVMRSLELMDRCLQKYPQFEEALCFRGRLHMQTLNLCKAESDFKAATVLKKTSFLTFVGLGDCYRAMNKNEAAIDLYKKARQGLLCSEKLSRSKQNIWDIELKMGICLYSLQRFKQSLQKLMKLAEKVEMRSSELYYYKGLCQLKLEMREKGLLDLEYSMRLQTNFSIVKRAYRRLILNYLQNYQFYQAVNTVKLGEQCAIELPEWKKSVESFMLIIKGSYSEGVVGLKTVCQSLKDRVEQRSKFKFKKGSMNELKGEQNKVKFFGHSKKPSQVQSPRAKQRGMSKGRFSKRKYEFSSKSVQKAIAKINSVNAYRQVPRIPHEHFRYKTQHLANETMNSPTSSLQTQQMIFSVKQKEIIYPIILQFKAYGEFFMENYISCLETYEEYESYIKFMFGKESELSYNRLLCEAMLMSETDMPDDALTKYSECVENYFQKHGDLPPQPILYKIVLLVRLAAEKQGENGEQQDEQVAGFEDILQSTLKMMQNYRGALGRHHLSYYFQSLIYILQGKYQNARESLQKTLKLTEQCTWKYLYVKGVVQMNLSNFYDAIKEFSAGLILESRPELYLCRAICFLMLSIEKQDLDEQSVAAIMKSVNISAELSGANKKERVASVQEWATRVRGDVFLQNCFEDLQRYVQVQQDKLQISIWVSRILFATRSYEEAMSSLEKIPLQNKQMVSLAYCIEIYEGQFEEGGCVGLVIKSAFDGAFLCEQQQSRLLEGGILKNYNDVGVYDYLNGGYEKWLVILNLYVKKNYGLMLKYIQRQLFSVRDEREEVLLRYNLCVLYILMGENGKMVNLVRSLMKFQKKYRLGHIVEKMIGGLYSQDECLDQLGESMGIAADRLLSNYLPYRPVTMQNSFGESIRIYVRVNIPFPEFPMPNFQVKIDRTFILTQVGANLVEKKIQAPWIRRINNKVIQFTEKLDESIMDLGEINSNKCSGSQKELEVSDSLFIEGKQEL